MRLISKILPDLHGEFAKNKQFRDQIKQKKAFKKSTCQLWSSATKNELFKHDVYFVRKISPLLAFVHPLYSFRLQKKCLSGDFFRRFWHS